MHTYKTLTEDLEKSGLKRDDAILIHSSMKSIGDVEGRADTVLDVLMDYFGKEGLLVFPTLTWSNVNADQPIFDVRNTPSVVGILPQLFRQRPNVWRSLHPTHSVAAYGPEAIPFVEGHERSDTPANSFSPWRKLILAKAKIMFLGATISHNTFLHGVEEWFGVPEMLTRDPEMLYTTTPGGARLPVPCRRHLGHHSTWYYKTEPVLTAAGALTTGRFGDAPCHLLETVGTAEAVYGMLRRDPLIFTRD